MKKATLIFVLLLVPFVFATEEKVVISIDGMTCNGCVTMITKALNNVDGVKSANVTLEPQSATVVYDNEKASNDKLIQAITAAGYKAKIDTSAPAIKPTASTKTGCPMAAQCKEAGTKAACTPPASTTTSTSAAPTPATKADIKVAEAKAVSPKSIEASADKEVCPSLSECQELINFHEAMHPLHEAFSAGDFKAVRGGFKSLAECALAVKNMPLDKYNIADPKAFEAKRQTLLVSVDKLGQACSQDNDKEVAAAFESMHAAYVDLGNLAK